MGEASSTACKIVPSAGESRSRDRLARLLADHHAFVWRSLRRLGIADCDVEDASQQVFLVAYRRLADIVPESERSFLFQTALRVAADWRRARKRRCEDAGMELPDVADLAASPEERIDRQRQRASLDRVLEGMPMELRAVFVLFELEEMTMMEIATISAIPLGTVASRLRRARQAFRDAVKKLTSGPRAHASDRGGP